MKRFTLRPRTLLLLLLLLAGPAWAQQPTWQWATKAGQVSSINGLEAIVAKTVVEANGNTVVAGTLRGTLTLGPFSLSSAGTGISNDVFVARLSPTGQWVQAVRGGGPSGDVMVE